MKHFKLSSEDYRILPNGDAGFTLIFDEQVSKQLTKKLAAISEALCCAKELFLSDVIPSYQSITLFFDHLAINRKQFLEKLTNKLLNRFSFQTKESRLIEIPVCYETEYAPDLAKLAKLTKLPIEEVINRHTSITYWVNMLGFLPGFLYLSGLDKLLNCPRKKTPNIHIAPGSIAIGGEQTGIYPVASPGGWHVIGRTPIEIFIPNNNEPAIARPLDEIKFIPITKTEFIKFRAKQDTSVT